MIAHRSAGAERRRGCWSPLRSRSRPRRAAPCRGSKTARPAAAIRLIEPEKRGDGKNGLNGFVHDRSAAGTYRCRLRLTSRRKTPVGSRYAFPRLATKPSSCPIMKTPIKAGIVHPCCTRRVILLLAILLATGLPGHAGAAASAIRHRASDDRQRQRSAPLHRRISRDAGADGARADVSSLAGAGRRHVVRLQAPDHGNDVDAQHADPARYAVRRSARPDRQYRSARGA